ncbi:EAL domain-containing protein [Thiorhodococcus minor]|uniref:EAL domain-containing protein n=1 Tax=Thiorhodococcus minor TaxID=57489 RepID=A0A6M0K577_9GAMM|nr:EAL domain-containing protein [Thiorhodococcus minor]
MKESALPPDRLELEITENSLLEGTRDIIKTLERLKALGLRLAIDDFGTGYSSLRYLQSYPVDRLKTDQSFVRRVTDTQKEAAIVDTILTIARHLELEAIAEGVETEAQLAYLRGRRCPQAQGFYFSQPLPPDAATQWLRRARDA